MEEEEEKTVETKKRCKNEIPNDTATQRYRWTDGWAGKGMIYLFHLGNVIASQ